MLRGLSTLTFYAADLDAATDWYTELLGIDPYFKRPGYAEFRVGDYEHELGLIDSRYAPDSHTSGSHGAVAYWHVDDVSAAFERLLILGAQPDQAPTERGGGFTTASVVDPFGNVLGVMRSPHYLDVLDSRNGP